MIDNIENQRKIHALDNLKQHVLNKYFEEINLDEDIALNDSLIHHFFSGDLDNYYDSQVFDNMDKNSKKNVLEEVHKYQDLCFYDNNVDYWLDSCDGIPIDDFDLITYQLLDNFEFLVKLYLVGGKKSLELLKDYNDSLYRDKELSCVDNIRRNFINDELLFAIFDSLSNDNTLFDVFTKNEKNTLLEYPEGTLYFYGENDIKITNPMFLVMELYYRMNGKSYDVSNMQDFVKTSANLTGFFLNEDNFDNTVMDMFFEYQSKLSNFDSVIFSSSKIDNVLNRNDLRDKWIMQDEALLTNVEIPINRIK